MSNPKRLTRAQKEFMTRHTSFNPENWLLIKENSLEYRLINKNTSKVLILNKGGKYRYES